MTVANKRLGWRRSRPDPFAKLANPAQLPILPEVDPRDELSEVYDQGNLGSCTGNAVAFGYEYWRQVKGLETWTPSRLFIYWNERVYEGTQSWDSGAYGHDGFKCLRRYGVPRESEWPYDISRFADAPLSSVYTAAKDNRIDAYVHPGLPYSRSLGERVAAFKALLSNRQTIQFGFSVYESFMSQTVADEGVVPMPKRGEREEGGHEVSLIGYIAEFPHHALCRNSWGPAWGRDGYFLMPWLYLADPNYADDWRSIYLPRG